MRKSMLLIFLLLTPLTFASAARPDTTDVRFASDPTLSPDGETIVFSYDKDLWRVSADGGRATRLTGMPGEETDASISPNGRWLAFSSNQYGSRDVYVMPVDGGTIRRLTYHQANDQVESWNWGSDTLYFRSNRHNRITVFKVPVEGGTPQRLFGHYHNTVHNLVKEPGKEIFYFNESWESFIFTERKHYRGPFNPDIKSYNRATDSYAKLTNWMGKDMWPMLDREGNLYFVSDEANGEYNLYTLKEGEKRQLTSFNTSVRNPAISADGSTIVFEKEYQLYTYQISKDTTRSVDISIYKNNTLAKSKGFETRNEIEAFDVAPDEKKLAFVSRGELFVSDIEGKFIRQIRTPKAGRVKEVKWLAGSDSLIFSQTVEGYSNWFTVPADGKGPSRQITDEHQNNRMLALNSDRSKGVYLSGRDELVLIDLESMETKVIVRDEFWALHNEQPRFAPDDQHILYAARRNFEQDLFVYDMATGNHMNLTKTGVSEEGAFWSPDGNYIYFASTRTRPSFPRGGGETNLYRLALQPVDKPYRSTRFNRLFEEKEKDEREDEQTDKQDEEHNGSEKDDRDKAEKPEIEIRKEGLMQRIDRMGPRFGSQDEPFVIQQDDKTYIFYESNHDEGDNALWMTVLHPFEDTETKKIEGIGGVQGLTNVGDHLYGISGETIHKIDIGKGKATEIELKHDFRRNLRSEFNQMFNEIWANVEENFYHAEFHGVDWRKVKQRYESYLPYINSRSDFHEMVDDMLGELQSSHVGFSTWGPENNKYYDTKTNATGIRFRKDQPYVVDRIVSESPAALIDTELQPGDRLVAVGGHPVDPQRNREAYFSVPERQDEISLQFERADTTFQVKVHPTSPGAIKRDLYNEWQDARQQMVNRQTDSTVAYVHMKDMGGGELRDFLTEMTSEAYRREALILDLRYNTGGNVHDRVLQFLTQRPYVKWRYRSGDFAPQPNFTPNAKPIVLLVNEQTLSDGEVTAAGFKELNLGTVVGTGTYRWIIFTTGKRLVDGSYYRLPSWGVYTLEGENLEKTGVQPDIYVDNTFKDRLKHRDPQLQRAIKLIKEKLNQ